VAGYLLEPPLSGKRALEALYGGVSVASVDPQHGVAVLCAGESRVRLPLGVFADEEPETDRPISKAETLAIGREVCRRIGWSTCIDFLWMRKRHPIYAELFAAGRDDTRTPGQFWVLNHALSILQADVHAVAHASFNVLLDGGTQKAAEKKLERILNLESWDLSENQLSRLLEAITPFELRPTVVVGTALPGRAHLHISGTARVVFPFRDTCFLCILCSAHPELIWPDGAPAAFVT
jgi:hypothetical protein